VDGRLRRFRDLAWLAEVDNRQRAGGARRTAIGDPRPGPEAALVGPRAPVARRELAPDGQPWSTSPMIAKAAHDAPNAARGLG
jgi:hypothetical protein